MDRVVWVGASPRGDADEVRSVVSSALAVGFTEIVLSKPDESLQRIGRFSAILLKGTTFVLSDTEIGRLATIRSPKDEHSVRAMRGATKHVVVRLEPWKDYSWRSTRLRKRNLSSRRWRWALMASS